MTRATARLLTAALSLAFLLGFAGCSSEETVPDGTESQADDTFAEGADRAPTPRTLHTMAKILSSQAREDQAQFVLMRIIREHPLYMPAYSDLAELLVRDERTDDAIETLILGLKLVPTDPVLLNNLGMCWLLKRDYQRALESFAAAAAAVPEDARYRSNMATALGMMGRYDEALSLYEQVVPPDEAHHNLGVVCEARGDAERAKSEFQLAARIREEGPAALAKPQ